MKVFRLQEMGTQQDRQRFLGKRSQAKLEKEKNIQDHLMADSRAGLSIEPHVKENQHH